PSRKRFVGSTTRWVRTRAAGSTTTRFSFPQIPSLHLTAAPIVYWVVSLIFALLGGRPSVAEPASAEALGVGSLELRLDAEAGARVTPGMPVRASLVLSSIVASSLGVAALSGCGTSTSTNGVSAKRPAEALAAAKAAADAASSVHVSGSAVAGGSPIT